MSSGSEKTASGTKEASETGPDGDLQDAYVAPLHRNLKSRHLQMIGNVLSCFMCGLGTWSFVD